MTRGSDPVVDLGLQAERTALAWQRTALAMAVGALVAGRLAVPAFGAVSLVVVVLGVVPAVVVLEVSRRRYRAVHDALRTRGDLAAIRSAGGPIAALSCAGLMVALVALAFVLLR
ncbi:MULTISPECIES: DUF202 domain-containing protein [unclassified Modestobacter]|uniref:DUF202 domain-containing protein n=1 Tax=unclassified Modestobacter TaxID=2643866 RepID=UPI0022AA3052|nr:MULTISPECIES: DUF202 domain-containing protein [unclassified Modestobacter]MCZ2826852.1 DUF202 domain-containing protein [Modestobacter sp. VKM Ac-2981]MCZ2855452.1 DUF202 domain-containing protein [Modestobacter sp. VKM Ac-2982]